jgi:membrane-bound serine protease (ClpP class)
MNIILTLIAAGFILLFAEIFLPGLIAGSIGVLLLLAAVLVTGLQFGVTAALTLFGALSILGLFGFVIWMRFFPSSSYGKRLSLHGSSGEASTTDTRLTLVNQIGQTTTPLRPSGTALFQQQYHDVISEGTPIDVGQSVKVVKVEGSRIVVRKV